MGRDPPAPVYDGGNGSQKLYGRNLEGLAEGHGGKLHIAHVLLPVHDGPGLSREIYACHLLQAEFLEIAVVTLHPQPQPYGDQGRVAGIHHGVGEILAAVAGSLVAMDPPVVHRDEAWTAEAALGRHHTGLKARRRGDDLEGGSRFVCIVDAAVPPDAVQYVLGFLLADVVRRPLRQLEGIVQIEFRHIHAGVNLPVLRIHHQDGHAVRLLGGKGLFRKLGGVGLDVPVQADAEIQTAHRFPAPLPRRLHLDALGIRHCQDLPWLPLQVFIVDHLQPDDPLVVASGEAQYLAGQVVVRVIPLVVLIHLYPGQVVLPDPVPQFLVHIALDALHGGIFLHPFPHIVLGQLQLFGQDLDDLLRILQLVVDDGYGAHCPVVRQHRAVAVKDAAPGRLDAALPFMELVGHSGIVLRLPYAQVHQPSEQA